MPTDSSAEDRLTQRVDELLSEMTPAEKAGQLTQYFYFRLPPQADTEPALGVDLDAQPRAVEWNRASSIDGSASNAPRATSLRNANRKFGVTARPSTCSGAPSLRLAWADDVAAMS